MSRRVVVHNYPAIPRAAIEEGFAAMSLPEIAERLGITRQRVWQVYRNAMAKLVAQPEALQSLRELARERQRLAEQRVGMWEVEQ
ncbi:MAG TPA: sigma factor-like helix-turn-helix DNA-binding protein [Clostridia bacterium]|nr:sigma factor-like helix-turn-helix DNA-binding protein [Clostridia bacterium]